MKLAIFANDPHLKSSYEQGIEVVLNLAEAGIGVKAVMIGDFYRAFLHADEKSILRKKIKQLELFDVELAFPEELTNLLNNCDGAMSF